MRPSTPLRSGRTEFFNTLPAGSFFVGEKCDQETARGERRSWPRSFEAKRSVRRAGTPAPPSIARTIHPYGKRPASLPRDSGGVGAESTGGGETLRCLRRRDEPRTGCLGSRPLGDRRDLLGRSCVGKHRSAPPPPAPPSSVPTPPLARGSDAGRFWFWPTLSASGSRRTDQALINSLLAGSFWGRRKDMTKRQPPSRERSSWPRSFEAKPAGSASGA